MALESFVFSFRLISKTILFLFRQERQFFEADTAALMKRHLPPSLLAMVEEGTWPGECLLVMGNPLSRPSASEIAQNYVFLRPLVILSPRRAPLTHSMLDLLFKHGVVQGNRVMLHVFPLDKEWCVVFAVFAISLLRYPVRTF